MKAMEVKEPTTGPVEPTTKEEEWILIREVSTISRLEYSLEENEESSRLLDSLLSPVNKKPKLGN